MAQSENVEHMKIDSVSAREGRAYDLADHFLACAHLGRYLTVAGNTRFVITDDFKSTSIIPEASAVAAVYSKDPLVAQAALVPLSSTIPKMDHRTRDKYERLFLLIEEQTLSVDVKRSARSLLASRFRESEIIMLEAELGDKLTPARRRYRKFLGVVKQLMDRQIATNSFVEEFNDFTRNVAGKLDFGIYSFCLDSIFRSLRVPETVKNLLVMEIIKFSSLIRRELISNILSYPGQTRDMVKFIDRLVAQHLDPETVIQIALIKDLKLRRYSMEAITALAAKSGVPVVH